MEVHEKIKVMRLFKGLTQEDMAEKLGYGSVHGYAKLERGEISPTLDKLEEIAKNLDVTLQDLLGLNESNVVHIAGHSYQHNNYPQHVTLLTESQCTQELEKARLIIEQKTKEIELLNKQIEQLQKINALLEKNS
jgi:transcriptional regulator with XRE-family HTH domain